MNTFAGVDTTRLLTQAMKTAEMNHRILANNVSNADTPNFTPIRLNFQSTLRDLVEGRGGIDLRTSRPRHLDQSVPRPQFERLAILSKNDYNKVDLDQTLSDLSENTGRYTLYARMLAHRFGNQRTLLQDLAR